VPQGPWSITMATSAWHKVPLTAGSKVVSDDTGLPATGAPPGTIYLVLSSAQAGGLPAQYTWDTGASQWQQLGGASGTALDLTGGTVIYPRVLYHDGELPASLTDPALPTPSVIGDVLVARNTAGYPVITAVSKTGSTWSAYHPQRMTMDTTGAGRPAKADYPMQMNIGISGGLAHITHIADRSRDWVPLAEKPVPLNLYQQSAQFEFDCSGQQRQSGHQDHAVTLFGNCEMTVAGRFRSNIEIGAGADQGFNVKLELFHSAPGGGTGALAWHDEIYFAIWGEHWSHKHGFSCIFHLGPNLAGLHNRTMVARLSVDTNVVQAQSGNWIQLHVTGQFKKMAQV
jgi:hypothetical protein